MHMRIMNKTYKPLHWFYVRYFWKLKEAEGQRKLESQVSECELDSVT